MPFPVPTDQSQKTARFLEVGHIRTNVAVWEHHLFSLCSATSSFDFCYTNESPVCPTVLSDLAFYCDQNSHAEKWRLAWQLGMHGLLSICLS